MQLYYVFAFDEDQTKFADILFSDHIAGQGPTTNMERWLPSRPGCAHP